LTLQPTFLSALESDQEQPIRIQADAAIVDETSGSSVYKGNVIITQGTLEVTANEVEIFTADSEVIQIIAKTEKGSEVLAHYQQQINEAMDMVVADAKKITYLVQEERLHLSGDARLQQVQDVFTGQLLYYDLGRGIVNLNSSGGSDRVNMTIIPKNSSR
jgi:lipopolysaccharide export system protein LptA